MKKVVVIGGGASGLIAAIYAARQGAQVTIIEKMEKPGKKLLMTGNGKCNLTNLNIPAAIARQECFYSGNPRVAYDIVAQFPVSRTLDFFQGIGLLTRERDGYVYPYSEQALAVLETLLAELLALNVKIKCLEEVVQLEQTKEGWLVHTKTWQYSCDRVILCAGGKSAAQTGSDGSGYSLAKALGHPIIPVLPALTPLIVSDQIVRMVSGVRSKVALSLLVKDKVVASQSGELQWTDYGVSGIVIFQISRIAADALAQKRAVSLHIDLLPEYDLDYLIEYLKDKPLAGILQKKMLAALRKICGEDVGTLIRYAKNLNLSISGTKSFETAQVCSGGVSLDEVNPNTLESKKAKGLFFAGELLDVDGICGGYNLQWAWSSGYTAGIHAGNDNV